MLTQDPNTSKQIALELINILTTPFEQTEAYRHGLIDRYGNPLVPPASFTPQQSQIMPPLVRLMLRIKKIIGQLPGPMGEYEIRNLLPAFLMMRECYELDMYDFNESKFFELQDLIDEGVVFAEELLILEELLNEDGVGVGAMSSGPTNVSGSGKVAGTTLDSGPVVTPAAAAKYKKKNAQAARSGIDPLGGMTRRTR